MRHQLWKSALVGASCVVFVLLPAGAGHAADDAEISEAVTEISRLYEELEYEQAFALIQRTRRVPRDVDGKVTLLLYEGVLWCEMGNFISGQTAFRNALLMRPDVKLPEKVAPKVEKSFEETRLAVAQERALVAALIERARVESSSAQKGHGAPVQEDATKTISAQAVRELLPPSVDSAEPPRPAPLLGVDVAAEGAVLMSRLASLSEQFHGTESFSTLSAFQELNAIARQIKAATAKEELEDASCAMDFWEARYLVPAQLKR